VHDPDEVYTEYRDQTHDPWRTLVVPVLKQMPRALLAERAGLSDRAITALRNGHAEPHARHRDALTQAAGDFARERVRQAGAATPRGDLEACAAWLAQRPRAS
jgi:hypothetical protein